MASRTEIEEVARRVDELFHPEKIILFGSHARGDARTDSDVDLLVVMEHSGTTFQQALAIAKAVRAGFWVDYKVWRARDVRERYELGDPVIRAAVDEGVVLYERAA